MTKMTIVAMRFMMFGSLSFQNTSLNAHSLSFQVKRRWNSAAMARSNLGPWPMTTVVGENELQAIDSQMLVAMKRDIGAEAVAFLEEFVEKNDGGDELNDEQ